MQTDTIDGEVLAAIVSFVHETGMDLKDLRGLEIRHVFDSKGEVHPEMKINKKRVAVTDSIRSFLPGYIDHLKKVTGRRILQKSPLFPNWKNNRLRGERNPFYSEKTLNKHFRRASFKMPNGLYSWYEIKAGPDSPRNNSR